MKRAINNIAITLTCLFTAYAVNAAQIDDYELTDEQKEAITLTLERERCYQKYSSNPFYRASRDIYIEQLHAASIIYEEQMRSYKELDDQYWEKAWQLYIDHGLIEADQLIAPITDEMSALRIEHLGQPPQKPERPEFDDSHVALEKLCAKEVQAVEQINPTVRELIEQIGWAAFLDITTPQP